MPPGPELPEIFPANDYMVSSVMTMGVKIGVSSYISNVAQEGIISIRFFSPKPMWHSCWLCLYNLRPTCQVAKLPPFIFHRQIVRLCAILLQDKVWKHSMIFLRSLFPANFSKVSHHRVIREFYELVKCFTIPQVKLKQNALSNLRGIVNTLGALKDNGLKNNHRFGVPLHYMDSVKF